MHALATLVYFELKYCERCGGLWLRPEGAAGPYCPNCDHIMAALPARTPRASRKVVTRAPAATVLLSTAADVAQPGSVGVI